MDYVGAIRLIRNNIVHNKGVCYESPNTRVFQWGFAKGEPLEISTEQMISLIDIFPREETLAAPAPRPPGGEPALTVYRKIPCDFFLYAGLGAAISKSTLTQ